MILAHCLKEYGFKVYNLELPSKEVTFHKQQKNLVIWNHEFDATNSQCTGHLQSILIYITYKLPVQCISVQVHLLRNKLL